MHVIRDDNEKVLHISHLFRYISAYEHTREMQKEMEERVEKALKTAKETTTCQYVDLDGEMELRISPGGYITLMVPWKQYRVPTDEEKVAFNL